MNDLINAFAHVAATGYCRQFLSDSPVMNEMQVRFCRTSRTFYEASSLSPLCDDELVIETLYDGMYGQFEDANPEEMRTAIIDYICNYYPRADLLEKLEPAMD